MCDTVADAVRDTECEGVAEGVDDTVCTTVLRDMAKSQAMFVDRKEISGPGGSAIGQVVILPAKEK